MNECKYGDGINEGEYCIRCIQNRKHKGCEIIEQEHNVLGGTRFGLPSILYRHKRNRLEGARN